MENVYLFEIFLKSAPSLRALSQQEQTGNGEIEISDKIFRQNEVGYLFDLRRSEQTYKKSANR